MKGRWFWNRGLKANDFPVGMVCLGGLGLGENYEIYIQKQRNQESFITTRPLPLF